jgi:hypothetical protein
MTNPGPGSLTLLVVAIDEMRETTSLIPVADASRSLNRSWWRNIGMLFARSRAEVNAGNALQYLADNVARARGHWREVLSALGELQRLHGDNEVVADLGAHLSSAGVDGVLQRLELDAIPRGTTKTAVYLAAVVDTIHSCEHLAVSARSKLNVQQMRTD